jgi:hypothetical protein
MQDEIKVEYTFIGIEDGQWVDAWMTNKKGTQYSVIITRECTEVREVFNLKYERYYCLKDAPKWVQKTVEEQLPIVTSMLACLKVDY